MTLAGAVLLDESGWMSRVFEQEISIIDGNHYQSGAYVTVQATCADCALTELAASKTLAKAQQADQRAVWDEPGPIQPTFLRPDNAYTRATQLLALTQLLLSSVLSAGTCSQCSAADPQPDLSQQTLS